MWKNMATRWCPDGNVVEGAISWRQRLNQADVGGKKFRGVAGDQKKQVRSQQEAPHTIAWPIFLMNARSGCK